MKHLACLVVAVLAFGCSSSRHSSSGQAGPDAVSSVVNPWSSGSTFGEKVCKDYCGVCDPKTFRVTSFQDVTANDLCGLPWDCHYRCSADCATVGDK